MPQYKLLDQKNISYNLPLINRLSCLYKGGYDIKQNASMFLNKLQAETQNSYEDRLKNSSYLPILSDIINYFTAHLFSNSFTVSEAADKSDPSTIGNELDDESIYRLFIGSADLSGRSLEEVLRDVLTNSLLHKCAYLGIDFPKDTTTQNLIESEVNQSLRPYTYSIDNECVIDWSLNEVGKFNWVKLKYDQIVQLSPLSPPLHKITFKIWTLSNGFANYEIYESQLLELNKQPSSTEELSLVESDSTSFTEIPILCLHLNSGLAIGQKIGTLCEEVYQRTSILVNAQNKSLNPIRVIKLGSELSAPNQAMVSDVQSNPGRHLLLLSEYESRGFAPIGRDDDIKIVEYSGQSFQIVAEQIEKLIERIKELVSQMANSTASNSKMGKSADGQRESRKATEQILTAYGNIVKDFVRNIFQCISSARSETILWQVNGLDNFVIEDRTTLLTEAKQFEQIVNSSKSLTFKKLYTEKVYLSLLDDVSHENALLIKNEIDNSEYNDNVIETSNTQEESPNNLPNVKANKINTKKE